MFASLRSHRTRQKSEKTDRRFIPGFLGTEGMLEQRTLLSTVIPATAVQPTYGAGIESTGPYYVNSYMDVQAVGHGSGAAGYGDWGELEFNYPTPGLGAGTGVSAISSVSLQIDNTSAQGTANYGAKDGTFSIYVIPNNTVAASSMTLVGSSGGLGSINVPGVTITSADLVGTWSTTDLPVGYTTYTGSTSGSTSSNPTNVTGSSAVLGSAAISWMTNAMNTGQNVRFAVVADDTNFQTDWEGNYSSNYPLLQLNATTAPDVNFQNAPYTVTEANQVPSQTTPLTFNITRQGTSSDLSNPTTIHWAATNSTCPAGGFTAQSGNVVFPAGATSEPVTIKFNDISTTQLTGVVNITLSDPGGNTPAPVFYTTTTTGTINYLQNVEVDLSPANVSVNESAGTVTLTVTRTGTAMGTTATTVNYATANGTPYLASNDPTGQAADDAQAGRDYTATSGTLSWAAGDSTSRTITVPILDVETFTTTTGLNAGAPPTIDLSRYFTVSLSNPSSGTAITVGQSTVTITDNNVSPSVLTSAATPTTTNEIEPTGPYLPYTDDWLTTNSWVHNSFGYQDMPELEWTYAGQPALYPTQTVSAVDSVRLSIYNTETTGGYGGTPGSFDVYLLTDNTYPTSSLTYQGGPGATGPVVIGSQASPLLIGTAYFPNNVVGYNDFTFDNLSAAVSAALAADLNTQAQVRFVITPSLNSPVAADWEGNWVEDQPQLTLLSTPAATLPAWLSPSSDATWNASTDTLTVTGAATIIADPGTASPKIVANGSAAVLTIQPATVGFVNLGGITLTNGASIIVPSVGAVRTHTNHNVIVLDSNGTTVPTFSIDSSSKLDLQDNDLIIQNGGSELSTIQADANTGSHGGTWTGNGLTSSVAATVDGNGPSGVGYEQNLLAVALNGNLPNGAFTSRRAGTSTLSLGTNDVIVKYTYNGDFTLEGEVGADAYTILITFYGTAPLTPDTFIYGDTTGDPTIDVNDYVNFTVFYGLGTGGANGPQL
jgi:hypothetical protein